MNSEDNTGCIHKDNVQYINGFHKRLESTGYVYIMITTFNINTNRILCPFSRPLKGLELISDTYI